MNTKYFILIAIIVLGSEVHGQSDVSQKQRSYATFNFISPFVGISPRWKAGIYTPISKNIYLGTELGFGSNLVSPEARIKIGRRYTVQEKYRSFEIGPELIFMLHPKHFISIKYTYLSHSSSLNNGTFLNDLDELYYDFGSLDYNRKVSGFLFFYGFMDTVSDRFGFMLKIGMGERNREITLSNIKNEELSENPYPSVFATTNDGSGNELDVIRFDLKIFYLFK